MTASELILKRLENSPCPLALFELNIMGVSENAAATRLSELAGQGKVVGTFRSGARFKEWVIAKAPAVPAVWEGDQAAMGF